MTARDLERLAGRCVMVGVRGSGMDDAAFREDLEACREAQVGGVILFDVHAPEMARLVARGVAPDEARRRATRNIESPAQLRELVGLLRVTLGPDLLVAIDQEGGAVARLGPQRGFPETLSAAQFARLDPEAQRAAAAGLVRPLAEAGIDINFAPCVDVAVDADGMIAGAQRSFGSDPEMVIACARVVIESHAAAGVAPCLKHFPGHGSARADSHVTLPDITGTHRPEVELAPYYSLAASAPTSEQVSGTKLMVMTGHLLDRELDPELPASLSPSITTGLLRQKLGFAGVIVTDSLDMRAIRDRWDAATAAVMALRAGADIAMDAHNLPQSDGAERPCEAVAIRDAIARAACDGGLDPETLATSAARLTHVAARQG